VLERSRTLCVGVDMRCYWLAPSGSQPQVRGLSCGVVAKSATAGEVASGMIGVLAGSLLGDRIPTAATRWVAAVLFVGFGVAMLVGWP
ncbi:MAG: TMEM165/GDT1 family protein, partial [Ilumatobacter sp.]|nr:TMEM165/GDT1 family protein [Ilumatobacter sp.]